MAVLKRDQYGNIYDEHGNPVGFKEPNQSVIDVTTMEYVGPPEENNQMETEIIDLYFENEESENFEIADIKKLDVKQLFRDFDNNTELAFKKLMTLQSNASPLKRGGEGIGFMADVLFMSTRNMFNQKENTLFDILTGIVSTFPENEDYIIPLSQIREIMADDCPKYVKKYITEAADSLSDKNTIAFEVPGLKMKTNMFKKPWHDGLAYNKPDDEAVNDEEETLDPVEDFIYFKPTKIFRIMVSSSTLMHGAHYKITTASKFRGHTRKLFYWLESRKHYRQYPTAVPGRFLATVEELQVLLGLKKSYSAKDIKDKILKAAKEKFDNTEGIDFYFEYTEKKQGKKIVGFNIRIDDLYSREVRDSKEKASAIEDQGELPLVKGILLQLELNDKEIEDVYKKYVKNKRDILFLTQAVAKITTNQNVENKAGYLCSIMDNGISSNNVPEKNNKQPKQINRDYDINDLESKLLNSNPEN